MTDRHYFKVTMNRFKRVVYARIVVARTPEEAILLAQWPVRSTSEDGPCTVEIVTDENALRSWGDPNDPDALFQD